MYDLLEPRLQSGPPGGRGVFKDCCLERKNWGALQGVGGGGGAGVIEFRVYGIGI